MGRGGKLESMSHAHVHVHVHVHTCTRLLLREACALERHVEALSRRLDLASISLEVRQLGVGLVGEVSTLVSTQVGRQVGE